MLICCSPFFSFSYPLGSQRRSFSIIWVLLLLLFSHSVRRRQWHSTPVLLPGKSHGPQSLECCSQCCRWGSDTTEWLHFHFSLSCIGEGNGNPLQCSCLEIPRDGEAWWAAVYEVAQNRTRLKWLSSSSSSSMQKRLIWNIILNNDSYLGLIILAGWWPTMKLA